MKKYILLTGATSGIGYVTAVHLNKKGYGICAVGRNIDKLNKLKSELIGENIYIRYDLSDSYNVGVIFEKIREHGIKLDGLVYCAGISRNHQVRGIDLSDYDDVYKTDYESYLSICSLFLKKEYSNDGASIVCISSLAAKTCYPGTASYSVSKSAMLTLNKVMSRELLKRKIRVNAILPGYVRTPMSEDMEEEMLLLEQPWGFIEPEEVAFVLEFLLSKKSRMITGSEIVISGGMNY